MNQPAGQPPPWDTIARRQEGVALTIIVSLPVLLAIFMAIAAPSYFRSLFASALGWLILAAALLLEALAAFAAWWLVRRSHLNLFQRRIGDLGIVVLLVFPTLWLVLLGPALAILLNPKT